MKNVPIKFRGVSELTGKTIYGVGVKDYGDNRVDIITGGMALEAVQADSVAQLVGYDVDGKEVYEGDTLLWDDGDKHIVIAHALANMADKSYFKEGFDVLKRHDIFKSCRARLIKLEEDTMAEKVFPMPVKKNKCMEDVAKIPAEDYYKQIFEEVLEAYKAYNLGVVNKILVGEGCGSCIESIESCFFGEDNEVEELVDIIACCVTRLEILGYDDDARQILYLKVNEKNRKRGYF